MEKSVKQEVKAVIRRALKQRGESVLALSRELGIPQKTLNNQINGVNPVSVETLLAIANHLRVGVDELLNINSGSPLLIRYAKSARSGKEDASTQEIPLYNMECNSRLSDIVPDSSENVIDYLRIPNIPQSDGAIYVRGDGMHPLMKAGDILVYKLLSDASFILSGEVYVVSFSMNGAEYVVIKIVNEIEGEPDKLKLLNYNQEFSPLVIAKEAITSIAIVNASVQFRRM